MDRGKGTYLSQSRLASSREKPRLENVIICAIFLSRLDRMMTMIIIILRSRESITFSLNFSTINFIFFPHPINRSYYYSRITTLYFVLHLAVNYNAPRERFRNWGRGNTGCIRWQISEDLSGQFVSQLALNKENIRPLCLPTVKLRGTRHYYLNGVKLLSRVSLSLSLYLCVCVLSSVHAPMHNAYSPPFACTLIDIPTISRFPACGHIIVVSLNLCLSFSPSIQYSCIKRTHEFEEMGDDRDLSPLEVEGE